MLTQIWGLYLGSRFRWRGVRWVTRTTEEWRIALKLPPQFAVTKKVSEMEEAGWLFFDRWARGYVTVRPTPELMTLMKTVGVFPVEMLKEGMKMTKTTHTRLASEMPNDRPGNSRLAESRDVWPPVVPGADHKVVARSRQIPRATAGCDEQ